MALRRTSSRSYMSVKGGGTGAGQHGLSFFIAPPPRLIVSCVLSDLTWFEVSLKGAMRRCGDVSLQAPCHRFAERKIS